MNGRTVYINRIWTKNMEESLAPSICNCQLQEVQGYLEDIRRIRVVSSFCLWCCVLVSKKRTL